MRGLFVPFALLLALATGAVLAETRMALEAGPLAPRPEDQTGNVALVRDWYAAANRTIATGDDSSLERLLAPGFVDHASPGEDGADALTNYLTSLHSTHPGAQIVPIDLVATGDRVVARVRVEGAAQGRFLGLPVVGVAVWGVVDVFRVDRDGIVEHWGDGRPLARLDTLVATPPIAPTGGGTIELERRTYPPGAGEALALVSGFTLVLVETGELRFAPDRLAGGTVRGLGLARSGEPTAPMPISEGTATALATGDTLLLEGAVSGALRNDGAVGAVALVLTAAETAAASGNLTSADDKGSIRAPDKPAGKLSPGTGRATWHADRPADAVIAEPLAGGPAMAAPTGHVSVTIGRAFLPAGGVALHPVREAELLAVETGRLALTASGAWVRRGAEGRSALVETAVLGAGEGAFVLCCPEASYSSTGTEPLTVLVVTISSGSQD